MLSFSRRSLLVCLALAGCGFAPALGTNAPARALMGQVRAATPQDQLGFDFVKRIEERLGRPQVQAFDLTYTLTSGANGVGITADGAITRYNLSGGVDWVLTRHADGMRMAGGSASSFTSYSATGSTVAGLTARKDAARRLMGILADQAVGQMMAQAADWPQ